MDKQPVTMLDIERLKEQGRFRHAGIMAYVIGASRRYGCHYGMLSGAKRAQAEFYRGYDEATFVFHQLRS